MSRVDLQGRDDRRRALGRHHLARTRTFTIPPCIQVANYSITTPNTWHGAAQHQQILAHSSNIGAIEIGEKLGGPAALRLDSPLRLRHAHRRRFAGRGAGPRARAVASWSGSTIGNLPIGQGVLGHAAADRHRLRGDRQRRRAAPAPPSLARRRLHGGGPERAPRPHADGRRRVARHARGRPRAERHRVGVSASPATAWPARPAPPTRSIATGDLLEKAYVASFIGFAPGQRPPARVRRRRRRTADPADLRHRGRRAGLQTDHGLRAAISEDRRPDRAARMRAGVLTGRRVARRTLRPHAALAASAGGDADVEIGSLAYDSRSVRRGRSSSASAAFRATATTSPRTRSRRGAVALVVERRSGSACRRSWCRSCARGDGPVAARFYGDPTRDAARSSA